MGKTSKKTIKPLFAVKHDFIDSLDAFIQASMMLHLTVKSALDIGAVKGAVADQLKERIAAWEAATLSDQSTESL